MPLAPKRVQRIPPQVLYFDGIDDYVVTSYVYPSSGTEYTLTAFVYPFSTTANPRNDDMAIAGITPAPGQYTLYIGISGGGFSIGSFSLSSISPTYRGVATGKVVPFQFAHIALTARLGGSVNLYINGANVWTGTAGTSVYSTNLVIGDARVGRYATFYGYIAQILFYNRVLSQDEILWNYNNPDNPVRSGLVVWLHWDSIDPVAGIWYDKSGFGNHGTIYGATLVQIVKSPRRVLTPSRILAPVR